MRLMIEEHCSYGDAGRAVGLGAKAARNAWARRFGGGKGSAQAQRDRCTNGRSFRRWCAREGIFEAICDEHVAYWLGFLSADGSVVSGKSYSVQLELQEGDRGHVAKFRDFVGSSAPITDHAVWTGKTQPRVTVSSRRLVESLICLGVVPNKSLVISPCVSVPPGLRRHYWRGVVDGDGGIYDHKTHWTIELTGTQAMCDGLVSFLRDGGVQSVAVSRPHVTRASWSIGVGGRALARRAADLLYGGAQIFLDRKRADADRLLGDGGVPRVRRRRVGSAS